MKDILLRDGLQQNPESMQEAAGDAVCTDERCVKQCVMPKCVLQTGAVSQLLNRSRLQRRLYCRELYHAEVL